MNQNDRLLMVYTTHASVEAAKKIGTELLTRKLSACVNIFPGMQPLFLWPPKSGQIDDSPEVVMIVKTLESKYSELEKAVHELHPDEVPCILAWPIEKVSWPYYEWIAGELTD